MGLAGCRYLFQQEDTVTARTSKLVALSIAGPVVEMAVLAATGQRGAFGLAPQITALPPFGVFHDLRWLFVYHHSVGSFIWEAAALLAFRTLLLALLIRAAWPDEQSPPPIRLLLGRTLAFSALGLIVLSPLILLIFAASATALTLPWFGGILPMFVISLFMHPWVITGGWGRLPTFKSLGWILLAWAALTLAGAALELTPIWAAFLLAAVFGLFNALAWSSLTRSLVLAEHPAGFRLVAPLAILLPYGALLGCLHLVFSGGGQANPPASVKAAAATENEPPKPVLLLVQGLGSSWSGGNVPHFGEGFHEVVFSYRGLGPGNEPLSYGPSDTVRALTNVVHLLERQVQVLAQTSGQPLRIVCISEGSLVTQMYLASHPRAPINRVIIASPILAPSLVYFPPEGQDGWGKVSGLGLHGWLDLFQLFGWRRPSRVPVLRSMLEHGPVMSRIERCPMGPAPETVLMPLSSSVMMPLDLATHVPTYLVGLIHGDVLRRGSGNRAARAALAGERPSVPFWRTFAGWAGAALGSAWRVPPLAPALPPAWKHARARYPAMDCAAIENLAREIYQPPPR